MQCLFQATFWGIAFSALTLLVGRQEWHPACKKLEWWGAGVVICLERGADLHVAQLMPLPLTVSCFSKIRKRLVLPFWYRLTWVVLDKGPLNGSPPQKNLQFPQRLPNCVRSLIGKLFPSFM